MSRRDYICDDCNESHDACICDYFDTGHTGPTEEDDDYDPDR